MTDESCILLATMGQRPQAITMALDVLLPRYRYQCVGILHTEPQHSGIADAFQQLMRILKRDYAHITVLSYELQHENGAPLLDITDLRSAETYFRSVFTILRDFRSQNHCVHLLVAGGRKAMSIYATLAAVWLFGDRDRVWTILTPEDLMSSGMYHVPRGRQHDIQVVALPVRPSRLLPSMIMDVDPFELIAPANSPREQFLNSLTIEERALIEVLSEKPYASNKEIADHLFKSCKTIENQLRSIYMKLAIHFEVRVTSTRKRQVLVDVIAGRV